MDRAVAAARAAFPAWRDLPLIARSEVFFAWREQLFRHREELAALITRDHGKTFPDALAEVMRGLETVEFAAGLPVHLAGMMTPNVSSAVDAFTLRGPLGVVAAITPFNFPVMVPMWIVPIALACGNTVLLKPSSHTPGATQLQAELWKEAGAPDGTFNVVYGGREAVTAIVEHPDIRAIQFVGSTAVGRYVYEEGTKRGKRVGSYTSAKNAMVVLPDADLEMTADAAVASGFGSAGERCMAQTLVIAVGDMGERLRPRIEERIARLRIGPGMEPGVDMGPIYTREHRESIIRWIGVGEAEGAELVVDGRSFVHPTNPDGFFLGVTLFDHVTPDPALQARGRRPDDRGQRPDPGPGRLPLLRRGQGVRPRRPRHARRGRHPLLHPAEDGHRALARARAPGPALPRLPRQQLGPGPRVRPDRVAAGRTHPIPGPAAATPRRASTRPRAHAADQRGGR